MDLLVEFFPQMKADKVRRFKKIKTTVIRVNGFVSGVFSRR